MERKGSAEKRRHSLAIRRKGAKPYRGQFQRHAIARRPARLTSAGLRCPHRQADKLPRGGRRELTRGLGDERRPKKGHRGKLRTAELSHDKEVKTGPPASH